MCRLRKSTSEARGDRPTQFFCSGCTTDRIGGGTPPECNRPYDAPMALCTLILITRVPNVIRLFRELNPDIQFSLRNILTADQIRMLEGGSLDIGFLRLPIGGHSQLEVVTVHREPFVLVVPSRHKLAKRKRVRLSEVASQDFVMYERTHAPGFHDLVFGMLRNAGIVPQCQSDCGGNAHTDLAGGCRNGSFHSPRFGGQT